jgi:uncharacterized protein YceK
MKKKLLITIPPLASAILFSGCATIVSRNNQEINVTSYPSHQEVQIGSQTVTTPAIVTVERSKKNIVIKSKNCNNQQLLKSKINPWFLGNGLLFGWFFWSSIDYATGAMWKYDDNVNLNCQK